MKVILILIVTIFLIGNLNAQWTTHSIDTISNGSSTDITGRLSIVSDNSGTQHAAWLQSAVGFTGFRVYYSFKSPGQGWTTPVPVTDGSYGVYSSYIGVHKATGHVSITYVKDVSSISQVFISSNSGGTFSELQITSGGSDKYSPAMKIDNDGKAHLTWVTENANSEYKIFYSNNLTGGFTIDELTASNPGEFGSGASPYIEVASDGVAYIAFRSGGFAGYKISVANNNESGGALWSYTELETPNTSDYDGMMEFDAAGNLHIVVSGADDSIFPAPRKVYYLMKAPGQSWITAQEVSVSGQAINGSLKVEANGDVHIVMNEASGNFILGTIIYATNKSGSWQGNIVINDGEAFSPNISLDNDGKGYILAYQGDWNAENIIVVNSQNELTAIENISSVVPAGFYLKQNYPNPFNPETLISFNIPESGFVKLAVYDMLGREIAKLFNGELNAGSYSYNFNATGLNSGAYVYRLETSNSVLSKKMILLK